MEKRSSKDETGSSKDGPGEVCGLPGIYPDDLILQAPLPCSIYTYMYIYMCTRSQRTQRASCLHVPTV